MITTSLERFLSELDASVATEVCFWSVSVVFILAIIQANKGKHSRFLEYAPTLMTTAGILGTFVGVVIGLMHFDTNNIDQSMALFPLRVGE